jgi:hypothetical protein
VKRSSEASSGEKPAIVDLTEALLLSSLERYRFKGKASCFIFKPLSWATGSPV